MIPSAVHRAFRPLRSFLRAFRYGWRWEKVSFTRPIPLRNGRLSREDGGQMWQRWDGERYEFVQLAMMP